MIINEPVGRPVALIRARYGKSDAKLRKKLGMAKNFCFFFEKKAPRRRAAGASLKLRADTKRRAALLGRWALAQGGRWGGALPRRSAAASPPNRTAAGASLRRTGRGRPGGEDRAGARSGCKKAPRAGGRHSGRAAARLPPRHRTQGAHSGRRALRCAEQQGGGGGVGIKKRQRGCLFFIGGYSLAFLARGARFLGAGAGSGAGVGTAGPALGLCSMLYCSRFWR